MPPPALLQYPVASSPSVGSMAAELPWQSNHVGPCIPAGLLSLRSEFAHLSSRFRCIAQTSACPANQLRKTLTILGRNNQAVNRNVTKLRSSRSVIIGLEKMVFA